MAASLTSCMLTDSLVLGKQIKEQKVQERERLKGGMREVLVGKLNVAGSGGGGDEQC